MFHKTGFNKGGSLLSRCSKLFYSIHAGENQFDIALPYSFAPTTIQYKLILNTYLRPHRFYTIYIFQVLTFLSSRQWRFRQKFPQKEHDRPASHHEDANGRQREREAGRRA